MRLLSQTVELFCRLKASRFKGIFLLLNFTTALKLHEHPGSGAGQLRLGAELD
jgi:hypothetical protein